MNRYKDLFLKIFQFCMCVSIVSGCGVWVGNPGSGGKGGASAQVQMKNKGSTSLGLADTTVKASNPVTPDIFGVKMVAIYLTEDVDPVTSNNIGNGAHLWTNPKCDDTLDHCAINSEAGQYQVTDYFNFARTTSEVNKELNSQVVIISEGTYRYLRVDMAGKYNDSDTVPNIEFGLKSKKTYHARTNFAGGYTVKLTEPLVIAEGDSVLVTLDYDYANSFYDSTEIDSTNGSSPTGATDFWNCGGETVTKSGSKTTLGPCLLFTGFTPNAVKQKK